MMTRNPMASLTLSLSVCLLVSLVDLIKSMKQTSPDSIFGHQRLEITFNESVSHHANRITTQYSTSRKHLRTKVTPDLHLTYSKNGRNLGLVLNDKKWKFLHKFICCGDLLESPRGGDSNR